LNRDGVREARTVLHFRHWLERHELTRRLFDKLGILHGDSTQGAGHACPILS